MLLCMAGCGSRGRVIPKGTMAKIYADMFIADQWLRDHQDARTKADTTLFFEPVFAKYGYSKKDYVASVDEYVKAPDQHAKILHKASKIIDKKIAALESLKKLEDIADSLNSSFVGKYSRLDFRSDTTMMLTDRLLWPDAGKDGNRPIVVIVDDDVEDEEEEVVVKVEKELNQELELPLFEEERF